MKKLNVLACLITVFMILGMVSILAPKSVNANGENNKRYLGSTCESPDESWRCNNCIEGNSECYDHTCMECYKPSLGN
jgi:hypothetical protein